MGISQAVTGAGFDCNSVQLTAIQSWMKGQIQRLKVFNGLQVKRYHLQSLGRVGEVLKVDSEGDIVVQFAGCQKWLYNPACLSLAPNTPVDDLTTRVHISEKLQLESPQNGNFFFLCISVIKTRCKTRY